MNIRISQATASTKNRALVPAVTLLDRAEETRPPFASEAGFKFSAWQVRTTLWIGIAGPPIASFVLLSWVPLSTFVTSFHAFDLPSYPAVFLLFAVPVGYVFGVVPALLAGAMYSLALTAMPAFRSHTLLRSCVGAVLGGLCGGLWFHVAIGSEWPVYGSAAALVMAILALRRPEPPASSDLRYRADGDYS